MPSRYAGAELWTEGGPPSSDSKGLPGSSNLAERWLQALYESPLLFSGILADDGRLLDGNRLSIEGCGLVRADTIGKYFWTGGWWSHDNQLADQIHDLVVRVILTKRSVRLTTRYFANPDTVRMVELILQPVHEDLPSGERKTYVVATGLDVTDSLLARAQQEERLGQETATLQRRALDVTRDLESVTKVAGDLQELLTHLAAVAINIAQADAVEEITSVIFNEAFPAIGAAGGALIVWDHGEMRVYLSEHMDEFVRSRYGTAPVESPLPGRYVARTGETLILPNRAAGIAFLPEMEKVYEVTQRLAWVYQPLKRGRSLFGSLAVSWTEERVFSPGELNLVEAIATQCAQAIERIQINELNREATAQIDHMLQSVQRSLLTSSPVDAELEIAAKYVPAAQAVQVGGDWYDSFTTWNGSTILVVGDVAGHDGDATASMAQLRNLLRGLAIGGDSGPAVLLGSLDKAIDALGLNVVATVVIAELNSAGCRTAPDGDLSASVLRWASAGHLPPFVRSAEGDVHQMAQRPDLLLGVDCTVERSEYSAEFAPGATAIFFTDGLIERRGQHLDEGLEALESACRSADATTAGLFCDALVDHLVAGPPADDVVVLVVKRQV